MNASVPVFPKTPERVHIDYLLGHGYTHLAPFCFHVILATTGEGGKELFLQEIEFMKHIGSHRNVLSMLGYWIKSEPIMLILEYVPHGDLLQWLRKKRQVRNYKIVAKTIIL